jgi:bacterioferritin (cytochrome b1)
MLAEDEPFRQTIGKRAKEFLQSDLANESKIASQWLELFEKVQS